MNKLYHWTLYDKNKIDMTRLATTINRAWITSVYVIAKDIDEAKRKISESFDIESGRFILNFDLGDAFISKTYVQDGENSDVFVEDFVIDNTG